MGGTLKEAKPEVNPVLQMGCKSAPLNMALHPSNFQILISVKAGRLILSEAAELSCTTLQSQEERKAAKTKRKSGLPSRHEGQQPQGLMWNSICAR
ncbi:hypothetical protein SRHO_G00138470 [Serrasalmus rhombeus]